jgi:hypothetical protein
VHKEFVDTYAKSAEADQDYAIYVCQEGGISYYNAYASALKDANRMNDNAFRDFTQLMDQYSISCQDVGLCQ